jgi:hypothetical protein
MRQCLFCDNAADSLEHLWPLWILERVKPRGPLQHSISSAPVKLLAKPEIKMKCVCTFCNNGWMHDLEQESIPVLGAMLHDISTPLDSPQQTTLARWSIKTAMVVEAVKKGEDRFFTQTERGEIRANSAIPSRTNIWLGRYASSSIGAYGTDLGFDMPDAPHSGVGCVTTIIVGHVAVQVLALRVPAQFSADRIVVNPRAGSWERLLVQVWPVQTRGRVAARLLFR